MMFEKFLAGIPLHFYVISVMQSSNQISKQEAAINHSERLQRL